MTGNAQLPINYGRPDAYRRRPFDAKGCRADHRIVRSTFLKRVLMKAIVQDRGNAGGQSAGGTRERAQRPSATGPPQTEGAFDGRVFLLISNLEYGGAQRQVVELANRLNADGGEAHVCCLSDYVPLASDLHDASRRLHVVAKRGRFDIGVVPRLARLLRDCRADVVHSFLIDAEIAGRLAGRLCGRLAVIGSERNTDYRRKRRHLLALRLTGRLFDAIIANSNAGKRFQIRTLGIASDRIFVVHNGVDVERFVRRGRSQLRASLGIGDDARVVGMFCSFKRQKNHAMFFRMAERVLRADPRAMFLCVGSQLHGGLQASDVYQRQMHELVGRLGLNEVVRFVGNRDDVVDAYNGCDVTVLTSQREGTPNVLLESMACQVPVVATDVSDNARVVPDGRVGYVVPLDDDAAMAERVTRLLSHDGDRRAMGASAREWVSREFSIAALARKTTAVYGEVLRRRRKHAGV